MLGIPVTVITKSGFSTVLANAIAGLGFAPEAPVVTELPISVFNEGGDLTPINDNFDKIVAGLTIWKPVTTQKGTYYAQKNVNIQGKDLVEFLKNTNNYYISSGWSDGLPIVPPTEELVNWIMGGTDLPPTTVVGQPIPPKGGLATVHDVAVNLAMAGGRPEYLPVVLAIIDALGDPNTNGSTWIPTTRNMWPGIIVSGNIGKQIRVNSGYGTMGPSCEAPAQGPIGRSINLMLTNFGGGVPGKGTMAIFGANRYCGSTLAEDEEGLPSSWPTFGQDIGLEKGANAITLCAVESLMDHYMASNFGTYGLDLLCQMMNARNTGGTSAVVTGQAKPLPTAPTTSTAVNGITQFPISGIILLPRAEVKALVDAGMTKNDVKKYIWDRTHMTNNSGQLTIVTAGGDQGSHLYWLLGRQQTTNVTRKIQLPARWTDLLAQAEIDLGAPSDQHPGSQ